MLQWYEQNPLWEIYKDYTTTKAVITTPKAEKMNLVQSHRLEVYRKGFRTHRDNVSVSTQRKLREKKYCTKIQKYSINKKTDNIMSHLWVFFLHVL